MQPLVFYESRQYLSLEQQKVVSDFFAEGHIVGNYYKKNDQIFRLMKVEFPKGAKTPESRYLGVDPQDGTRLYRTPLATSDNPGGQVVYARQLGGGEQQHLITIAQWLTLVDGAEILPEPEVESPPEAEVYRSQMRTQHEQGAFKGRETFAQPSNLAEEVAKKTGKRKADTGKGTSEKGVSG